MQKKDYESALAFFHLAAEGSSNPAFAHYQRARVYAMRSRKKEMLAELRLALSQGFHDPSALEGEEFRPLREDADFQVLAATWKKSAN